MVVLSWCRSPGPGCVSGVSLDLNWLLRLSPLLPEGTERGRGGLLIPCPSPGEIKVKATQTVLVVTVVSGTKTTTGRRGHTLSSMRRKVARAKIVGLSVQVLPVLPASTIRSTIPNQTPGLRGFAIDAQWPRYTKGGETVVIKRGNNVYRSCVKHVFAIRFLPGSLLPPLPGIVGVRRTVYSDGAGLVFAIVIGLILTDAPSTYPAARCSREGGKSSLIRWPLCSPVTLANMPPEREEEQ